MTAPDVSGEPDVSVVIVTYNSGEQVGSAIESARAAAQAAGMTAEIIVVDNASADGTADIIATRYPDVLLIRNDRNTGFGAANNVAFPRARGAAWLLLNPDARLEPATLGTLAEALRSDPRLALVAPSVRGGGWGSAESAGEAPGLRSLAGHFLFLNRLLPGTRGGPWRGFQHRMRPRRGLVPVGWASAAVVLARPAAIREVDGFDASIFMYGEDLDLGRRLAAAGWALALEPAATAVHAIGGSQKPTSTRWIDGVAEELERRGRSRPAIAGSLLIIGLGLGIRWIAATVARGEAPHRQRMRAGAFHATTEAVRRLAGPRSRRG